MFFFWQERGGVDINHKFIGLAELTFLLVFELFLKKGPLFEGSLSPLTKFEVF